MKFSRALSVFTALMLAFAPAGRAAPADAAAAPDAVRTAAATLPPLAGMMERLAAGRWTCVTLVRAGQDPHTYEPTPRQLKSVMGAAFLVGSGMPFEQVLGERLRKLAPQLTLIVPEVPAESKPAHESASAAVAPQEHGHDHGAGEPHCWLDPAWLDVAAAQIYAALTAADPAGREAYAAALAAFREALARTLADLRSRTWPASAFVAVHPAYGGFAHAAGLEQLALEENGQAPGPRRLKELRDRVRELGVQVLFVQNQTEARRAAPLVRALGLRTVEVNPLGRDPLATLRALADGLAAPAPAQP